MSTCSNQSMTIESKRGDTLEIVFNLSGHASYAGLTASSQLRVCCADDIDTKSRLPCGHLAATFTVACTDNQDGTASIMLSLTGAQTATIPAGTYEYDVQISKTGWGPFSTPTLRVVIVEDVTK